MRPVHLPAPLGGINAVDPASGMPPTDCVFAWNVIPDSLGLRARLGYQEWATGLTGALSGAVRTMLPFRGSATNSLGDKLFAVTDSGIWDVSSSGSSPTQAVTFSTQTGDAGFGSSVVVSTVAGRFLLYCDEENGLYVYEEGGSWTRANEGTTQPWEASTPYIVGDRVVSSGNVYECDTAGTSDSSSGPTGTGNNITDGTARWDYVSAAPSQAIGPSLADQQDGLSIAPADFAFVTVWKSRVWLVEKGSTRAWYLDVGAIYGTARSFDFGVRMRTGGELRGLYSWSYDGGSGMDTLLVGLSGAGDVVIYQGTDPTSASTFGLKGTWYVGGVPRGRRIATEYGGEVLVLGALGVVPLSKLVVGGDTSNERIYATRKIAPLFAALYASRGHLPGWALVVHPTDNALMVLVPTTAGAATEQLVMSFATQGWFRYRDLPILSAEVWDGRLHFGSTDGRVCRNVGYVDNVQLSDSTSWSAVDWSLLTAYQTLGSPTQKQVGLLRPVLLGGAENAAVEVDARYRYDTSELSAPSSNGGGGSNAWGSGTWGSAVWTSQAETMPSRGATGSGREVAIALRGKAIARTTLVGVDVYAQAGGPLG